MHKCVCVCVYVFLYDCMHVCLYERMNVCMYLCHRTFVDALKYLKSQYKDGTYDRLSTENMRRWYDPVTLKLKPEYEERKRDNAERWVPLKHTKTNNAGRKTPLQDGTKAAIDKTLKALRLSTASLSAFVMSPRGIVHQHQPHILKENGGSFGVSSSWVRLYVWKRLKWRYRKGTQATYKKPASWKKDIETMIMRASILIDVHKIKPEMFINFDQTGVHLVPNGGERTYETKGSTQVDIAGSDDKRQITVLVTSTAAGELLPLQIIFTGSTSASLPSVAASKSAIEAGFHLTNTKNHWSNLQTMKLYIENIIVPYVTRTRMELKLDDDSRFVLLMDCWSVHRGKEFRNYLTKFHPTLIPLFIPAGCTGDAQPADLTIQRAIKIAFKKKFQFWLANVVLEQLKLGTFSLDVHVMSCHVSSYIMYISCIICHVVSCTMLHHVLTYHVLMYHVQGVDPADTKIDFSMPTLRELIPGWLLDSYKHVQSTDVVTAGWRKSGLLDAWDDNNIMNAHRHNASHRLFDSKFSYAVPEVDEPQITTYIGDEDDDEDDDDEYDEMSDTDEEQEHDLEQQEHERACEAVSALASIAATRDRRQAKPTRAFSFTDDNN